MQKINFDFDWEFGMAKLDFFGWSMEGEVQKVNLPHDFTIKNNADKDCPNAESSGYFTGNTGCYKKSFEVPEEWNGGKAYLEIDGAYMNTEISVNGNSVSVRPNGYSPYNVEITDYLEYGKTNSFQIVTDNSSEKNSRWYSGSGIYRHVNILVGDKIYIAPWGVFAKTVNVIDKVATLMVEVTIENKKAKKQNVRVDINVNSEEETCVAFGDTTVTIPAFTSEKVRVKLFVKDANLWDIDNPYLYKIVSRIKKADKIIDSEEITFGIRTISMDAVHGFRLNSKEVKLKGGCVHHDNGLLGAAAFDDAEYRKMKLHKDNGYNAIRCAHNPPSKGLLDACDKLGLLVMNESFDTWRIGKCPHDYHLNFDEWWERDTTAMVMRDRNHPSIIMWSIGNEIPERSGISEGAIWSKRQADLVRSIDDSRFVISGVCGIFPPQEEIGKIFAAKAKELGENTEAQKEGAVQDFMDNDYVKENFLSVTEDYCAPLDVVGYNYLDFLYEKTGEVMPNRVICGTESFPLNIAQVWELVERFPYVIGDFTWTSFDYIGEAGIGKVFYSDEPVKEMRMISHMSEFPWRTANCADFDICGFGKPQLYYRRIVWGSGETYIAVRNPEIFGKFEELSSWGWPDVSHSWNWNEYEGKSVAVDIYSMAEEVELFINGISKGKKTVTKESGYRTRFETIYEKGEVKAISYIAGQKISDDCIKTVGAPKKIRVTPETSKINADGQSLCYVKIEIVDEKDNYIPNVEVEILAKVEGDGVLEGFGSGNPKTADNYASGICSTYEGRAIAIIRSGKNKGEVTLIISSEHFSEVKTNISTV